MFLVKIIMGLLLLGFALFLIWVLMVQLGVWVASLTLVISLLILGLLYLRRDKGFGAGSILFGLGIFGFGTGNKRSGVAKHFPTLAGQVSADVGIVWQAFDAGKISALVADGKTVFVDVTAAWCVNCQFNKVVALDPPSVRAALGAENIVAMQADWTNHDPAIGSYLAQFGRARIPFNIVYSPAYPKGEILPTALSKDIVLKALDR